MSTRWEGAGAARRAPQAPTTPPRWDQGPKGKGSGGNGPGSTKPDAGEAADVGEAEKPVRAVETVNVEATPRAAANRAGTHLRASQGVSQAAD